jgi:hypothetical protein
MINVGPACLTSGHGIIGGASSKRTETRLLAQAIEKPINWTNAMTLISVAILVGTELIGAAAAAGWAIGGLFGLGPVITHSLEGLLILLALIGLFFFLRAAVAHEPIR